MGYDFLHNILLKYGTKSGWIEKLTFQTCMTMDTPYTFITLTLCYSGMKLMFTVLFCIRWSSFVYRVAAYVDSMKAWYDIKTKQEILNKTVFAKVQVRFEDNFQVVVRRTIVLLSSRNRLMQPNVQMFSKYTSTTVWSRSFECFFPLYLCVKASVWLYNTIF